jgi:hypothetical protein
LFHVALDGRLRSASSTFCIKNWDSLEQLARILRIKYNLSLTPDKGRNEDVRPYLIQELKQRSSHLKVSVYSDYHSSEESQPYHIHCMQTIVKNDIKHYENALALVTGEER